MSICSLNNAKPVKADFDDAIKVRDIHFVSTNIIIKLNLVVTAY
jgi:hypothetical protein